MVADNRFDKQLERSNFESDRSYNLAKSGQEWGQLMQKETFDFNKAQAIWDNNFKDKTFQQSMNDAAASRGLQWASLNQRDKEFLADQTFRDKSFTADQEQRTFDNGLKEKQVKPESQTAETYSKYTDGVARFTKNPMNGTETLANPVDVEKTILLSDLPDSEKKKLYLRYSLKWGG